MFVPTCSAVHWLETQKISEVKSTSIVVKKNQSSTLTKVTYTGWWWLEMTGLCFHILGMSEKKTNSNLFQRCRLNHQPVYDRYSLWYSHEISMKFPWFSHDTPPWQPWHQSCIWCHGGPRATRRWPPDAAEQAAVLTCFNGLTFHGKIYRKP